MCRWIIVCDRYDQGMKRHNYVNYCHRHGTVFAECVPGALKKSLHHECVFEKKRFNQTLLVEHRFQQHVSLPLMFTEFS